MEWIPIATLVIVSLILVLWIGVIIAAAVLVPQWVDDATDDCTKV